MSEFEVCPGPLVWFDVPVLRDGEQPAAILECSRCSYVMVSGSFLDPRHAMAPVLREGLRT